MLITRVNSRPAQLFEAIDQRNGIGLEIGALDNPAALRSAGTVYYVDYCSRDALVAIHANTPSVNVDKIVNVDFVSNGSRLSDVVPSYLKFDYVIASHVIEHVPDIISWLQDIGNLMKPGGILSLIVPNKEYTFDIHRAVSEQKDFFAAFIQKQIKPSPIQVFDSYRWHSRDGKLVHTLDYSIEMATKALTEYVDCHCWVFTAETFHQEIFHLTETGRIPFELKVVTKTPPDEIDMFAQLIRTRS